MRASENDAFVLTCVTNDDDDDDGSAAEDEKYETVIEDGKDEKFSGKCNHENCSTRKKHKTYVSFS